MKLRMYPAIFPPRLPTAPKKEERDEKFRFTRKNTA
jgi:hypothetical protein